VVSLRPGRMLPALENLSLSGLIVADALIANESRLDGFALFTNVEDRVLDLEVPPVTTLGGTVAANLRWNAASGELAVEARGERLAIAGLTPLTERFDVFPGRIDIVADLNALGYSLDELFSSLDGEVAFVSTGSRVDIGLVKQLFTAIAALSPSGEAIEQWPDLIDFAEVRGELALEGGLGSEHSFSLRMDNLNAEGRGIADWRAGAFDYELLLTLLGEPFSQTIPISRDYQGVSWPVECAARFRYDTSQFCRPDFHAVREIFSRMGGAN